MRIRARFATLKNSLCNVGKNARELAYALQRSKLDCERRLVAQQRDYQACS
jgi:hypothetical protein